jgi:hypothetical protein
MTEKGEGHKTLHVASGEWFQNQELVDLLSSSPNKLSKSPDILQEGT